MTKKIPWAVWGLAAAIPVLAAPVGDPDLWWHLSAAQRIAAEFPVRADWLSWTLGGAPWINFEWLSGYLFLGVYNAAGLAGLWALKILLLGLVVDGARRAALSFGLGEKESAAAAALSALALLPRSDIRIELFSLLFFVRLWLWLLSKTKEEKKLSARETAGFFVFFVLWANLHAGFAYGLLLIGLYLAEALAAASARRAALACGLAAAFLGTFANPYGAQVYGVILSHAVDGAHLASAIAEWAPLDLLRLSHAPTFALVLLCLWGLREARGRSKVLGSPALWAALLIYGGLGLKHARLAAYFVLLLTPFAANAAARFSRANFAAVILAGVFVLASLAGFPGGLFRAASHGKYWPERLSRFLDKNPELAAFDAYHPWGWGGYVGFHLAGKTRVFQDGRSLFHGLLAEGQKASHSPDAWGKFLDGRGVKAAVLVRTPAVVPARRSYPDGTTREFSRPYYTAFMPKEKWALVYFDEKALFFIRRGALSERELAPIEYRLIRPGDEAALRDALSRGEIDSAKLEEERARHSALMRSLD